MPIVQRIEFPKKYPIKDTLIILVVLAAIIGVFVTKCSSNSIEKRVFIRSIRFEEVDKNFVRLGYVIENKGTKTEKLQLIARVFDAEKGELSSRLFSIVVAPGQTDYKSVVLDKWSRRLKEGELPHSATIEFYKRKLLGY